MKLTRSLNTLAALVFITQMSTLSLAETSSDNTKVNQRDRASDELTADQQKLNTTDTQLARKIRQDLIKDKSLSTYAQNIKIIAVNGKVTLKGPVHTENEENKILKYARSVAGTSNVTNEIEIVQSN